jgi:hypothetical protein
MQWCMVSRDDLTNVLLSRVSGSMSAILLHRGVYMPGPVWTPERCYGWSKVCLSA